MRGIDDLDRAVLECLKDGQFHSGKKLADGLGVSRAAIWKHIRRLESLGLDVVAWPRKGYRLSTPIEWLDERLMVESLSPKALGLLGSIRCHDVIDSTNSELMRPSAAEWPSGSVCLAEYQSAGRGRLGRQWLAPFGTNLCFSVLWRFDEPHQVQGLSLAVGVVLIRALSSLGLMGVSLKWPNDLLFEGKKLGGILIEMSGEAHGPSKVVMGVGLNRRLPKKVLKAIDQPAIDLETAFGEKVPERNLLLARLLSHLLPLMESYPQEGLTPYLDEWRAAHAFQLQPATLEVGSRLLYGDIVDITEEGLLLFREVGGEAKAYASGDVRLRSRTS